MDTSRITDKAQELRKNMPSLLRDRSVELLQRAGQLRDRQMPIQVTRRRRPVWRSAGLWFAGGMAAAMAVGYLFDPQRGAARRQMIYDKAMATGRDVQRWSGKKARHLRNKAMGTVAEMKRSEPEMESGSPSRRGLG